MYRERDHSGISGTGLVAEGMEFSNGQVALSWLGELTSITIHQSVANVEQIHGHHGATYLVFLDEKKPSPSERLKDSLRLAIVEHQKASKRLNQLIRMVTGDHPRYYKGRARTRSAKERKAANVEIDQLSFLTEDVGRPQGQDQEVYAQAGTRVGPASQKG